MQTADLRVTNGAIAGAWIELRLDSESNTVADQVPEGYGAYARVFHPAYGPLAGRMDSGELDALAEILAAHTTAPNHCYFGLRTSLGWEESFAADELKPLLELPEERDHVVLAGRLAAVDKLMRNWAGRSGAVVVKRETPNLIWPADRSWFVVSEVDAESTLVGGSAELIEAIIQSSALHARQIEPTDSLAFDAAENPRPTSPMPTETLKLTDGAAAGAWIEPELGGENSTVTRRVPEGYEAYVRIFHPAYNRHKQPIRWAVIAEAVDGLAHPEMQWEALIHGIDWDAPAPSRGKMDLFGLDVLCAILTGHTAESDRCCFALHATEGWEDWFPPDEPKPRLGRIDERDYVVLSGPLSAVGEIGRDWLKPEPQREAPQLIWPEDRSWFVTSSGGRGSTLVGGSAELIEEILHFSPMLEAWQIEPTGSLASNADRINNPMPRLRISTETLKLTDGAAAGAWIVSRLGGEVNRRVADKVPEGFEAYARVFPPANRRMGEMDHAWVDTLCGVIAARTTAPDHCHFAMNVRPGWEDSFFSPEEPQPLLRFPRWDDYLVFAGPLAAVDQIAFAWPHHSGKELAERRTPRLIWPADHSWFVTSEGGRGSILVGGSAELIEAIVASPALEAWQVEPTDSLAFDADEVNGAQV